jgi:hypothetical protein
LPKSNKIHGENDAVSQDQITQPIRVCNHKIICSEYLHSRMLFMIFHDATLELCVLVRHELVRGQVRVIGIVFDDVVATLGCNQKME